MNTASTAIDLESSYAQAYALYQAGHAQKAADIFRGLCSLFPSEARFWFGLGASLQENREYRKALYAWAMNALIDPANPYPHFHAAQCLISLEQISDAKRAIHEAKTRSNTPKHPLQGPISVLEQQWEDQ